MTITVSVMYPNEADKKFDLDYYTSTHMKLVEEHWKPMGMISARAIKGVATPNPKQPHPYTVMALIEFPSVGDFQKAAMSEGGKIILGDIPNFTDGEAVVQISENL